MLSFDDDLPTAGSSLPMPPAHPQAFLQTLVAKTRVHQFEITRPSLHDIFVRIAQPEGAA